MANETTIVHQNLDVRGQLTARTMVIPSNTLTDVSVNSAADVSASKLEHQYQKTYAQESATTAADESRVIHTVYGATGSIVAFECGCVVANIGAAIVEFDLKKNGTTVLNAELEINSGHTAYQVVAASLNSALISLVDGDVLSVSIDGTAGGGTLGKGCFCTTILREKAS